MSLIEKILSFSINDSSIFNKKSLLKDLKRGGYLVKPFSHNYRQSIDEFRQAEHYLITNKIKYTKTHENGFDVLHVLYEYYPFNKETQLKPLIDND